jgi:hypothetical protein
MTRISGEDREKKREKKKILVKPIVSPPPKRIALPESPRHPTYNATKEACAWPREEVARTTRTHRLPPHDGVVNAHVNRVVMTVDFSPPYLF